MPFVSFEKMEANPVLSLSVLLCRLVSISLFIVTPKRKRHLLLYSLPFFLQSACKTARDSNQPMMNVLLLLSKKIK
jgi:hypothetical protein